MSKKTKETEITEYDHIGVIHQLMCQIDKLKKEVQAQRLMIESRIPYEQKLQARIEKLREALNHCEGGVASGALDEDDEASKR